MTESEILKALLHCNREGGIHCKRCPMWIGYGAVECIENLLKNALDLINRQKAEVESLESRIFALNDTNQKLIDSQEIYWINRVKEFAERLKEKAFDLATLGEVIRVDDIDNLVKEMTEGNDA